MSKDSKYVQRFRGFKDPIFQGKRDKCERLIVNGQWTRDMGWKSKVKGQKLRASGSGFQALGFRLSTVGFRLKAFG